MPLDVPRCSDYPTKTWQFEVLERCTLQGATVVACFCNTPAKSSADRDKTDLPRQYNLFLQA